MIDDNVRASRQTADQRPALEISFEFFPPKTDVMEEKFWDIDIKTDGEIASIYFKYSFHIGDYKYNWGDEAWDLVKTADGWKIVSVIYSTTENPEPRQT